MHGVGDNPLQAWGDYLVVWSWRHLYARAPALARWLRRWEMDQVSDMDLLIVSFIITFAMISINSVILQSKLNDQDRRDEERMEEIRRLIRETKERR